MRKWWQRWWQVRWQIHNKRNHVMSHKITNRLPHLCNIAHSWVFISVIFMTVSKIKCQNLEMIYNFLGKAPYSMNRIWWNFNWAEFQWINGNFSFGFPSYSVHAVFSNFRKNFTIFLQSLITAWTEYDGKPNEKIPLIHWNSAQLKFHHIRFILYYE